MAVVARSATTLTHTAAVTVAASPGIAANLPDGDAFPNGGSSVLVMNNTGAAPYFVDIFQESGQDGLPAQARRFTVPATTIHEVKLGPPGIYGATVLVKAENVAVLLSAKAL
ncbi:MAG: hypothetical protein L0I24_08325 [Pseudonocardia sp.]|nr:hypothetical protein [Pseudonocardia sp.]